jgi:hypothetical protein
MLAGGGLFALGYIFGHVAAALGFSAVLLLPGLAWDVWLFRDRDPGPLRPIAFSVLSVATWMALAFALCAMHLLSGGPVLVLVGLMAVAAAFARLRARSPASADKPAAPRAGILVALPLIVVFAGFVLLGLSPVMAQDADTYHLTIPRLYLAAHGFRRIPFNVYSNWPHFMELLYALVLLFHDYVTAALIHVGFGVLVTMALIRGSRLAASPGASWAGWLACAMFWANQVVQIWAGAAMVDLPYIFFFVSGFLFVYRTWDSSTPAIDLLIAGVCTGVLAGLKVNGILGAACIAGFALLNFLRRPQVRIKVALLAFAVPAAALTIIWPIKSWVLTGNPVYPFLHSVFGGPEWSEELTAEFRRWHESIGGSHALRDELLLPVRVFLPSAIDDFGGLMTPAFLAIVPLTLLLGWRSRFVRACLGVGGVYFLLWASSSQQARFLMPSIALLALGAGVAIADAVTRWAREAGRVAIPALCAVAGVFLLWTNTKMLGQASERLDLYRRDGPSLPGHWIPQVFDFIDHHVRPNARVLMLDTNRAFFLHRDYVADSFYQASQIVDWLGAQSELEDVHRKLREKGITHILFQDGAQFTLYPPGILTMLNDHKGVRPLLFDQRLGQWLFAVCDTVDCAAKQGS